MQRSGPQRIAEIDTVSPGLVCYRNGTYRSLWPYFHSTNSPLTEIAENWMIVSLLPDLYSDWVISLPLCLAPQTCSSTCSVAFSSNQFASIRVDRSTVLFRHSIVALFVCSKIILSFPVSLFADRQSHRITINCVCLQKPPNRRIRYLCHRFGWNLQD